VTKRARGAGRAALLAPDYVREAFEEKALLMSADEGSYSLRSVEWAWDPDPALVAEGAAALPSPDACRLPALGA
jgi:hypothetical protein